VNSELCGRKLEVEENMNRDIRLKVARIAAGLNQFALAQRVGISESTISKIETRRVNPARDVQQRIAVALGKQRWEVF